MWLLVKRSRLWWSTKICCGERLRNVRRSTVPNCHRRVKHSSKSDPWNCGHSFRRPPLTTSCSKVRSQPAASGLDSSSVVVCGPQYLLISSVSCTKHSLVIYVLFSTMVLLYPLNNSTKFNTFLIDHFTKPQFGHCQWQRNRATETPQCHRKVFIKFFGGWHYEKAPETFEFSKYVPKFKNPYTNTLLDKKQFLLLWKVLRQTQIFEYIVYKFC